MEKSYFTRRFWMKSSAFGLLSVPFANVGYSSGARGSASLATGNEMPNECYPSIKFEVAREVVGAAHFNLDRLKELVEPRPELARAVTDWAFGDWESAIDAASHVGRKDIADYLINKGAVPTIFTFAMFGAYDIVKSMIEAQPGIQRSHGVHGFSLLHHARQALAIEEVQQSTAQKLVDYLEALGDADGKQYLPLEDAEKEKYVGDYRYGEKENEGFSVKVNMRKMISLGKPGKSGGSLYRIGENEFTYNGAPSVVIAFKLDANKVVSLTVKEPGFELVAVKIS